MPEAMREQRTLSLSFLCFKRIKLRHYCSGPGVRLVVHGDILERCGEPEFSERDYHYSEPIGSPKVLLRAPDCIGRLAGSAASKDCGACTSSMYLFFGVFLPDCFLSTKLKPWAVASRLMGQHRCTVRRPVPRGAPTCRPSRFKGAA